jgi:hypothetical protein
MTSQNSATKPTSKPVAFGSWKEDEMYRTREWIVSDPDQSDFAFVRAETQKEAIRKALAQGIRPARSSQARPRTGHCTLMDRNEFNQFLKENS